MSMRSTVLPFVVAALAASSGLAAETYVVDKVHSEASFQVRHLGISNVRGRFEDFEGTINIDRAKPESSSVELTIKTASVNTDSEARDKDLRGEGFFESDKFPTISFKSTRIAPKGKDNYDVTGNLTMHGVSKQITLPVAHLGFVKDPWGNEKAGFALETTLNRKDYGLLWNKALDQGGFLLGDDVKVVINLETAKKKN